MRLKGTIKKVKKSRLIHNYNIFLLLMGLTDRIFDKKGISKKMIITRNRNG